MAKNENPTTGYAAFSATSGFCAWRVVIDPKCVAAVSANLASQKLIEDMHNKRLDSISSKKAEVELYTVSMATIKELYKLTMENVSGFGTESRYYTEIGRCALDIITDVPGLVKTVNKAPFSNKLLCLNELGNLVTETQQLVADFMNIVCNAKVQNPLKGQATVENKGDGYNFLDRYERLTVANTIYTDLMKIRYKVERLVAMAQICHQERFVLCHRPGGMGQRNDHAEPGWQHHSGLERACRRIQWYIVLCHHCLY